MPFTPIYNLPYERLGEQPGRTLHGGDPPGSSQILASVVEAVLEANLSGVARVLASSSDSITRDHSSDDTYTGDADGANFEAPLSGAVVIHFYDNMELRKNGSGSVLNRFMLGNIYVRTGDVIGGGSDVRLPDDADANIVGSISSSPDGEQGSASSFVPLNGLTPGSPYNIEHVYKVNTTATIDTATSHTRRLLVIAVN